jgi:hypothetical protein
MDLRARLGQLPEAWRGRVPLELAAASLVPSAEPMAPPSETRWEQVRLPYRAARAKVADGKALVAEDFPELFIVLGWMPVPELNSLYYMIPPDADGPPPAEILVPRPEEEQIVTLAYERAQMGTPWEGTAWLWPAKYSPAKVSRKWKGPGRGIWDGVDEHGHLAGGLFETEAGWRDTSSLATFEIGILGLWSFTITWKPQPIIRE